MDWEQEQEWQGYLAISHSTCLLDSFHADLNGSTYLELFRTLTLPQWITLNLRGVMPKLCLEVVSALLIPFIQSAITIASQDISKNTIGHVLYT